MTVETITVRGQEKVLLSVPDVCALTSLGRSRVFELLRQKRIRSVHVGRSVRVPASALLEWLDSQTGATEGPSEAA